MAHEGGLPASRYVWYTLDLAVSEKRLRPAHRRRSTLFLQSSIRTSTLASWSAVENWCGRSARPGSRRDESAASLSMSRADVAPYSEHERSLAQSPTVISRRSHTQLASKICESRFRESRSRMYTVLANMARAACSTAR
ncbi:MAG: hypothetical protein JWN04_5920 [Myxococcaceae bacterium]|nr:hypothetical protein [Myxococcaceae bacterium]